MRRTLIAYCGRVRMDDIGRFVNMPISSSLAVPVGCTHWLLDVAEFLLHTHRSSGE